MTVQQWSTTASSNNAAPPTGAPEGQTPGSVNNVMREMMASVAIESQVSRVKYLNSVAGTNTITGSMTPALTAYSPGMRVVFAPANANTAAATLNINGVGAINIVKEGGAALVANDMTTTAPAELVMNGASNAFHLINPQASIGGIATSDFARLSQANTFTASGTTTEPTVKLSSSLPLLQFDETDAAADNKRWQLQVNGEQLSLAVINDAGSGSGVMTVDRTGLTVDSINLLATTVQANGTPINTVAAFKASSTARSSTTTFTSDPDLSLTLPAGTYEITALLLVNATTGGAGGFKAQISFSGSVTNAAAGFTGTLFNVATSLSGGAVSLGAVSSIQVAPSLDFMNVRCIATLAGANTVAIQWAQNSSSANAANLLAMSSFVARRIA